MKRLISISRAAMVCGVLAGIGLIGTPFPVFPQASATGW